MRVEGSSIGISLDVSRLEAPQQLYDADVGWVEHRPGRVSLFFAKVSRDRPGAFSSRLEARCTVEAFVKLFWAQSADFIATVERHVQQWPESAMKGMAFDSTWPSEKTHSEWFNFSYLSHSGSEASFDFYHVSAATLARLAKGHQVDAKARPVVRVQMTTFDMVNLLGVARPVVASIEAYLPEAIKNTGQSPQTQTGTD